MFTGLVVETGECVSLEMEGESARLVIHAPTMSADAAIGDSISVNGCCLTVTANESGRLSFDLLAETLRRTSLGELSGGKLVNLEPALSANARLGGHFVQGHVDTAARVIEFSAQGADHRLEVELPAEFAAYVVSKGSIAVDGISLTVAELKERSFVCWIIPHTFEHTNLREKTAGSLVNLEFDLLAKYVDRILAARAIASPS
jgi:riboflavin synthase